MTKVPPEVEPTTLDWNVVNATKEDMGGGSLDIGSKSSSIRWWAFDNKVRRTVLTSEPVLIRG